MLKALTDPPTAPTARMLATVAIAPTARTSLSKSHGSSKQCDTKQQKRILMRVCSCSNCTDCQVSAPTAIGGNAADDWSRTAHTSPMGKVSEEKSLTDFRNTSSKLLLLSYTHNDGLVITYQVDVIDSSNLFSFTSTSDFARMLYPKS